MSEVNGLFPEYDLAARSSNRGWKAAPTGLAIQIEADSSKVNRPGLDLSEKGMLVSFLVLRKWARSSIIHLHYEMPPESDFSSAF